MIGNEDAERIANQLRQQRFEAHKSAQDTELAVFAERVSDVCIKIRETLMQKRQAYGPGNLTRRGGIGIVVRAEDKLERLGNFYTAGSDAGGHGEGAEDAWLDLIGYAILGYLHHEDNGVQ